MPHQQPNSGCLQHMADRKVQHHGKANSLSQPRSCCGMPGRGTGCSPVSTPAGQPNRQTASNIAVLPRPPLESLPAVPAMEHATHDDASKMPDQVTPAGLNQAAKEAHQSRTGIDLQLAGSSTSKSGSDSLAPSTQATNAFPCSEKGREVLNPLASAFHPTFNSARHSFSSAAADPASSTSATAPPPAAAPSAAKHTTAQLCLSSAGTSSHSREKLMMALQSLATAKTCNKAQAADSSSRSSKTATNTAPALATGGCNEAAYQHSCSISGKEQPSSCYTLDKITHQLAAMFQQCGKMEQLSLWTGSTQVRARHVIVCHALLHSILELHCKQQPCAYR